MAGWVQACPEKARRVARSQDRPHDHPFTGGPSWPILIILAESDFGVPTDWNDVGINGPDQFATGAIPDQELFGPSAAGRCSASRLLHSNGQNDRNPSFMLNMI